MMSIQKHLLKYKIETLKPFSSFSHGHVKGLSSKHFALKVDVLYDWNIYCLQVRQCIFQPGHFTGWGSDGLRPLMWAVSSCGCHLIAGGCVDIWMWHWPVWRRRRTEKSWKMTTSSSCVTLCPGKSSPWMTSPPSPCLSSLMVCLLWVLTGSGGRGEKCGRGSLSRCHCLSVFEGLSAVNYHPTFGVGGEGTLLSKMSPSSPCDFSKSFPLVLLLFYCLLFTLFFLPPDNTSVTVHAVSLCSRQHSRLFTLYVLVPDNIVVPPCFRWCRGMSLLQTTHQLLFMLYHLVPDNTSVTVHAVSRSSRQHISYCSCCISLFQTTHQLLFMLDLLVPDNTAVTVHAVSPCSRQHISYCSCCISLFQTTLQLLFMLDLLVPDNTSVTVHAVSPCSRQHFSYCSCCISLFQTTHQLLFMLYLLVPDNTAVAVHTVSPGQ